MCGEKCTSDQRISEYPFKLRELETMCQLVIRNMSSFIEPIREGVSKIVQSKRQLCSNIKHLIDTSTLHPISGQSTHIGKRLYGHYV